MHFFCIHFCPFLALGIYEAATRWSIIAALSFTAIFDSGCLIWWNGGFGWMEENKKSGDGDVRAEALSWVDEWDKA